TRPLGSGPTYTNSVDHAFASPFWQYLFCGSSGVDIGIWAASKLPRLNQPKCLYPRQMTHCGFAMRQSSNCFNIFSLSFHDSKVLFELFDQLIEKKIRMGPIITQAA